MSIRIFALFAAISSWASPDNVVIAERYATDFVDASWDETTHISVCKPRLDDYELPWIFVRSGEAN